ncbi:Zinc finger MYM-type protein 1 [Caligus rogercresseyi]|uniref:Zinc finger MYM-type protein 1 n=1 Tax=Caligus rogercresseyi TaxID=217165 RepID=A0A7T8KJ39_CALRO|nr:Zinc finger MYM-type protein 1 [Caligus rogercresseyi]
MAHNKKLKTSKITSFFKHNEKEEHDDEQPSTSKSDDVGDRPVLPEVQPEESAVEGDGASEAKDDDEADAGFDDWVSPNHPPTSSIPVVETKTQKILFLAKWYQSYPWIHYEPSLKRVLCFYCAQAEKRGLLKLAKNKEPAFVSVSFCNWKKASPRFESHQASNCHRVAKAAISLKPEAKIDVKMDANRRQQQETAQRALMKVFKSLRFLLRQGLSFRGHTAEEGNFQQLLNVFRDDDEGLDRYLKRSISFTSPQAQEKMMQMFGADIVRTLAAQIAKDGPFGVMVDGTQDITGVEQEAICFRHVDDNLDVHEEFVGLYELPSTSGEMISKMIFDVITRLSLSTDNLRAQTYDGAANMLGQYKGCQAKVKERQPLALNFHCASHVANLIREMASSGTSESAVKANGLLDRFEKGATYLSLEMVTKPIVALEQLNRSCQSRSAIVSGMLFQKDSSIL